MADTGAVSCFEMEDQILNLLLTLTKGILEFYDTLLFSHSTHLKLTRPPAFLHFSSKAPEIKKYQTYHIKVDPEQDDKATEIKLCSFARPHMRAFHCSWWNFFIAFFIWFSIAPLLSEVRKSLQISKADIWSSSIASVAGTIILRFALGPMCDKYGARVLFTVILVAASIPTALTGLVNSTGGLIALRFFIGCAGSCFVMCQYW